MTQFNFHTTSEDAASVLSSHIKGRVVIVTGVSPGGLGLETARVIALHSPKLIILAGRSTSKLAEASRVLKEAAPTTPTRELVVDLSSNASVRKAAAEVNGWEDVPAVDIVINNAGIMACPYALSEDEIESQFAACHIGHFLFTQLIMEKVLAAAKTGGARVVNLSSVGYKQGPVRFEDWNFEDGKAYNEWAAYGQAKTANILYAKALTQRYKGTGLEAFSVHPGGIWTNLGHHAKDGLIAMGYLDEHGKPTNKKMTWKTMEEGTSTTIVAAFDPSIADQSGAWLQDCNPSETPEDYVQDPQAPEKLWKLSEKLVGQEFS